MESRAALIQVLQRCLQCGRIAVHVRNDADAHVIDLPEAAADDYKTAALHKCDPS